VIQVKRSADSSNGIIVHADLKTLRKGAEKILLEFVEFIETLDGERRPLQEEVRFGEAVIFREDIDLLPAEIVAVRLEKDMWFIMTTSEVPKCGFPTAKDAMRAAASEEKKLGLLTSFFRKQSGIEVEAVESFRPDYVADARRTLEVINEASRRYRH
jgi:hypothetical protein